MKNKNLNDAVMGGILAVLTLGVCALLPSLPTYAAEEAINTEESVEADSASEANEGENTPKDGDSTNDDAEEGVGAPGGPNWTEILNGDDKTENAKMDGELFGIFAKRLDYFYTKAETLVAEHPDDEQYANLSKALRTVETNLGGKAPLLSELLKTQPENYYLVVRSLRTLVHEYMQFDQEGVMILDNSKAIISSVTQLEDYADARDGKLSADEETLATWKEFFENRIFIISSSLTDAMLEYGFLLQYATGYKDGAAVYEREAVYAYYRQFMNITDYEQLVAVAKKLGVIANEDQEEGNKSDVPSAPDTGVLNEGISDLAGGLAIAAGGAALLIGVAVVAKLYLRPKF